MIAFGLGVKTLLWADNDLKALLPGGIHPDDIPDNYDIQKAGCVYKVITGEEFKSLNGPIGCGPVSLGFTWIGAGASENQAAYNKIAQILRANRPRVSVAGVILASLSFGNYGTDAVSLGTNPNENKKVWDFVITGVLYDPGAVGA